MSIKLTSPDDPLEHLHPDIRHAALADKAKRKELIQRDRWVSYPAGESAIERLFELADMPPRLRMPSILFWAKPNMGKTHIQEHFIELHKQRAEADPGTTYGNVFRLELNDNLTEKRFYLDILEKLNAPTPEAPVHRLQAMVMRQLEARGTG